VLTSELRGWEDKLFNFEYEKECYTPTRELQKREVKAVAILDIQL
jgi:hypothetical protein